MARTTRGTRILAAIGIATLTMIGNGSVTHAAPAPRRSATYIAPGGVYHFAYPATWTAEHPQGLGIDVGVHSPDENVWVSSTSISGTITDSKALLAAIVKPRATLIGKAHYHKYQQAGGITLLEADSPVRTQGGHVGLQVVEFAGAGGRTYLLSGVIRDVDAGTWKQDEHQLTQVVASFDVVSKPTK